MTDHTDNKGRPRRLNRYHRSEPIASCSGSCTKTCSRSTRNGSMPTATALPATTTSVDSLGSSRFSNPKAKLHRVKKTTRKGRSRIRMKLIVDSLIKLGILKKDLDYH